MNRVVPVFVPLMFLLMSVEASGQSKEISFEQLARRAEVVVLGTVSSMESSWNADRTRIQTRVTLSVDEYWKGGHGGGSFAVIHPGGEVGSVGEMYSHMPRFAANERVVIFAERDRQGAYRVSAGDQGKYTVMLHEVSGAPIVADGIPLEALRTTVRQAALPRK